MRLEFTQLNFGGTRRWLVCPCCQSKRLALYVAGCSLSCRVCLGLRHESNHENRQGRMFRRANVLRKRLGWKPGVANPPGKKPAHMHWRTFLRLNAELEQIADKLFLDLSKFVERAEARIDRMQR